jgi:hypothetical protein
MHISIVLVVEGVVVVVAVIVDVVAVVVPEDNTSLMVHPWT